MWPLVARLVRKGSSIGSAVHFFRIRKRTFDCIKVRYRSPFIPASLDVNVALKLAGDCS